MAPPKTQLKRLKCNFFRGESFARGENCFTLGPNPCPTALPRLDLKSFHFGANPVANPIAVPSRLPPFGQSLGMTRRMCHRVVLSVQVVPVCTLRRGAISAAGKTTLWVVPK